MSIAKDLQHTFSQAAVQAYSGSWHKPHASPGSVTHMQPDAVSPVALPAPPKGVGADMLLWLFRFNMEIWAKALGYSFGSAAARRKAAIAFSGGIQKEMGCALWKGIDYDYQVLQDAFYAGRRKRRQAAVSQFPAPGDWLDLLSHWRLESVGNAASILHYERICDPKWNNNSQPIGVSADHLTAALFNTSYGTLTPAGDFVITDRDGLTAAVCAVYRDISPHSLSKFSFGCGFENDAKLNQYFGCLLGAVRASVATLRNATSGNTNILNLNSLGVASLQVELKRYEALYRALCSGQSLSFWSVTTDFPPYSQFWPEKSPSFAPMFGGTPTKQLYFTPNCAKCMPPTSYFEALISEGGLAGANKHIEHLRSGLAWALFVELPQLMERPEPYRYGYPFAKECVVPTPCHATFLTSQNPVLGGPDSPFVLDTIASVSVPVAKVIAVKSHYKYFGNVALYSQAVMAGAGMKVLAQLTAFLIAWGGGKHVVAATKYC